MANSKIITNTDPTVDANFPSVTGSAVGTAKHGLDVSVIKNTSGELATILDESLAGTTYIGTAAVGASEASAVWQIKKMVEAAGVTTITYADGDSAFDNIWNNRASLTYS